MYEKDNGLDQGFQGQIFEVINLRKATTTKNYILYNNYHFISVDHKLTTDYHNHHDIRMNF